MPGPDDIISFPQDQGDFTVVIGTQSVAGTAIFDSFTGGIVTLNVTGVWRMGDSQLARVRIGGGGKVSSDRVLMYDSVLSGVEAEFGDLRIEHHAPLGAPSLALEAGASLVSSGPLVVNGHVGLDGSSWHHTGVFPGGDLRLRDGSRLIVRKAALEGEPSLPRLVVESGSTVEIDDLAARVDASGGASVTLGRAQLHSSPVSLNPAVFAGGGTMLTVADRLTVTGGPIQFQSGARLQTVSLSHDQGAFATEAIGSGSDVSVTGLLDSGLVAVRDGGSATIARVENASLEAAGAGSALSFGVLGAETGQRGEITASGGGSISGGRIDAGSGRVEGSVSGSGSLLELSGSLEAGGLRLTVSDGGRMDCRQIAAGAREDSTISVAGADSLLHAAGGFILGEGPHATSLTISDGGRVQSGALNDPGSVSAVGVSGGAEAGVLVINGGVLDSQSPELGVGVAASGSLNVRTGGRLLAAGLTLGALPGGQGTATGSGTGSGIEVARTLRIGREGEGTLTLSERIVVTAGRVEVGDSPADNVLELTTGAELHFEDSLFAGNRGRGAVRVKNGGVLRGTGGQPRIGAGEASPGAQGVIEVSGADSRIAAGDRGVMIIGSAGQGSLQVRDGAVVEAAIASVGGAGGSSGTATVTGAGSLWDLSNSLDIGGFHQPVPGSLTVGAGASVQVRNFLGVSSSGVISLEGGAACVGAGAAAPGTVRIGAGGILRLGGRVTGGRVVVAQGGRLEPGSSPGTGRADAGLEVEPGGTLEFEIGGTVAGETYDQLVVTGAVSLKGAIRLAFVNGFAPAEGAVFDLITAGSIGGTPGPVSVHGLEGGFEYELRSGTGGRLQLIALTTGTAASQPVSPELSIEAVHGLVVVSWPAGVTGWVLQSSRDPLNAPWTTMDAPDHRLTVPTSEKHRFFRLVRP